MSKQSQPFRRPQAGELARRLAEPRRFIQVVAGARQVGKTTLVQQVTEAARVPVRFASADEPTLRGADWVAQQWEAARLAAGPDGAILVIDEVQKVLGGAGLLTGLAKFAGQAVRQKGSSPKLQVLNTALMTAPSGPSFEDAREDREFWGRLVESSIGAHLANAAAAGECELFYWRERNHEVDFVVRAGRVVTAIEVKSGRSRDALPGLGAFADAFKPTRTLLVGGNGIPIEEFLLRPVKHWVTR